MERRLMLGLLCVNVLTLCAATIGLWPKPMSAKELRLRTFMARMYPEVADRVLSRSIGTFDGNGIRFGPGELPLSDLR